MDETRSGCARAAARTRAVVGLVLLTFLGISGALLAGDANAIPRTLTRARLALGEGVWEGQAGVVMQQGAADCGPAALATLLGTLGREVPPLETLATLAATGPRGTWSGDLQRAAEGLGTRLRFLRLPASAWPAIDRPLIAWINRNHFVVVLPPRGRRYTLLDPQAGRYTLPHERLLEIWSGEALVPETGTPQGAATIAVSPFHSSF